MQLKTYRGKEMSKLLARIRQDCGEEALIISTHHTPDRFIEVKVSLGVIDLPQHQELAQVLMGSTRLLGGSSNSEGRADAEVRNALPRILAAHGVNSTLIDEMRAALYRDELDESSVDRAIADGLSRILKFESRLPFASKVVALVGATGVGKTTTIAKLAARLQMALGLKVGIISADAYRIGATFQLQTFANMMRAPFQAIGQNGASVAAELRHAINRFSNLDLVLIDTPGSSPREAERVRKLTAELQSANDIERILVLPAVVNEVDLKATLKGFAPTGYSRLIVTKLDETGFMGPLINIIAQARLPVAFLTNGQRVPEDIEPASARRLGWMLNTAIH